MSKTDILNVEDISYVVIDDKAKTLDGSVDAGTIYGSSNNFGNRFPFRDTYSCNYSEFYLSSSTNVAYRVLDNWERTPMEWDPKSLKTFDQFKRVCNIGKVVWNPIPKQ